MTVTASAIVLSALLITPPSYHRIVSPSLQIPDDKSLSIPVGLLACQRDPLLRELDTSVISCRQVRNTWDTQPSGLDKRKKQPKGANQSSNRDGQIEDPVYEVILHDTVLFPEGGGQPSDIGLLRTSDREEYVVKEVRRSGGHAVHYVHAKRVLSANEQVTVLLGEEGLQRRLDHMCMHTSQHLLSALLETHLDLPTLSWALTSFPTPSYVELPRSLTLEEISRIQSIAHRLAYEATPVHVEVEPLDDVNHPGVVTLESGRTVGKALPQDYTGGVKRTVVIEGVDRNPCCGTHLPSLANLQLFLLPQTEALARGSTSTSRFFFLCGPRLHAHLSTSHNLLTSTASIMSCGPPLVPERVSQVVEERKRVTRRAEDLELELAKSIASTLLTELLASGDENRPFVKHYHRIDDPTSALSFLQTISSTVLNTISNTEKASGRRYLIIFISSPSSQSSTSTTSVLLLSSDEKLVKTTGDLLKSKLSVKGGGKGIRWSGKWTGVWKESKDDIVNGIVEEVQASESIS